jgi:hypothetical protein
MQRMNDRRSFASELFPAYTEVTTYAYISPVHLITRESWPNKAVTYSIGSFSQLKEKC